jgi:hypothetical protein
MIVFGSKSSFRLPILGALVVCLSGVSAAQEPAPATQDLSAINTPEALTFFETSVRPVLAEHCYSCHGPDKEKGGFRLDARAAVLKGGDTGPAIVPGDAAGSRLLKYIRYEGKIVMPPDGKLPEPAIEALTRWVELGAPWPVEDGILTSAEDGGMIERLREARESHWAFKPVQRPVLPATTADMAVDQFIIAKLQAKGLSPSEPADKRTLLRRVTYGLTGLPPTPVEVDTFLSDSAPGAYTRVVDRLLASPHYGERWGRYWLDIARYSDTKGYVFQEERAFPYAHTYRDYVINAFNDDKPYDRFLIEQLAADHLDLGDDKESLAAMGFLTIGRRFINNIHDITDDRIDVTTRGMMGLTVSCARCHEHKYDPIPTEDYYSLYGVFRSASEPGELPLISEPDVDSEAYQAFVKERDVKIRERDDFVEASHAKHLAQARAVVEEALLAVYDARDITEDDPFKKLAKERGVHFVVLERWRDYLKKKAEAHDPIFAPYTAFAALNPDTFQADAKAIADRVARNNEPGKPIHPLIAEAFKGEAPKSMAEVCVRYGRLLRKTDSAWTGLLAVRAQAVTTENTTVALPTALSDPNMETLRQVMYGPDAPTNVPPGQSERLADIPTRGKLGVMRRAVDRVNSTHPGRPDRAMVLADAEKPHNPVVFKRGKPRLRGAKVPRQFLAILSEEDRQPFQNGSGRLEFAEAIASPDNPLTARVLVNRVWHYHFGRPLVKTMSDFGLRSEAPTHPVLLDYLAARFMDEGWSIKKLHKEILLSQAYRQQSLDRPEANAVDPENRLLWRQNKQRLDFEAMRDSVLVAAGRLDPTAGGHAIDVLKPPFSGRRTVYSLIDRQNLPAVYQTFDFPNPDAHSPGRFRTTVPQQALFLLNSPFVVEQARALAARPELTEAEDDGDRIAALYHLLYQRPPDAEENAMGDAFINGFDPDTHVPPLYKTPWRYGYGSLDETTGTVSFTPLPHFVNGQWQGGAALPNDALGWTMLSAKGGHPGEGPDHATIRRWVAPEDIAIEVIGGLHHQTDRGDGVVGYVVSSRDGILFTGVAQNSDLQAGVKRVELRAGETLDLVVGSRQTVSHDSYLWFPTLREVLPEGSSATPREWKADKQFDGPGTKPLTAWEQYAQALLLTNEFMFLD